MGDAALGSAGRRGSGGATALRLAAEVDRALRSGARLVALLGCRETRSLMRALASDLPGRFDVVVVPSPRLGPRAIGAWSLDRVGALAAGPGGRNVDDPEAALLQRAREEAGHGRALVLCLDAKDGIAAETLAWLAGALVDGRGGLRAVIAGPDEASFARSLGAYPDPAWIRAKSVEPPALASPRAAGSCP